MYLAVRKHFGKAILLESSDYHGNEHTYSYICCMPYAGFEIDNLQNLHYQFPDKSEYVKVNHHNYPEKINTFLHSFTYDILDAPHITNGLFGYTSYNAIPYFEDLELKQVDDTLPAMCYHLYHFVIAYNHFNHQISVFRHSIDNYDIPDIDDFINSISEVIDFQKFNISEERTSNHTDESYIQSVLKGINHCYRGDVFQIVLSRRYLQAYSGDVFQVYRALRSINPSPYLFYFDYGNYQLLGSSPESQLIIKKEKVTIHPIAGTFRRTGNDEQDAALAIKLSKDEKENAEHIMLVDLARNDLSRTGRNVNVEVFKEVQYYSHVIHLVSKVSAQVSALQNKVKMIGDTFPAGTLSGAPKYKALQLIDHIEPNARGYYGGAIGFLGFNGDFNHAIMIRTFFAQNHTLHYQAGAGIVADSKPKSELQEVENKLMALKTALEVACTL
jgi:anthranilate synthase component 1